MSLGYRAEQYSNARQCKCVRIANSARRAMEVSFRCQNGQKAGKIEETWNVVCEQQKSDPKAEIKS